MRGTIQNANRCVCAVVNISANWGGAEAVLVEIVDALRQSIPAEQIWVAFAEDGPLVAKIRSLGCSASIIRMPLKMLQTGEAALTNGTLQSKLVWGLDVLRSMFVNFAFIARLYWEILRRHPTLVYSNGIKTHVLLAPLALLRLPLVWHLHDYVSNRVLSRHLLHATVAAPRLVIANSTSVAEDFVRVCDPRDPPRVIHNCVNLRIFNPTGPKANLDRMAGLPEDVDGFLRIGLVATFAKWKGHITFLRAIGLLRSDHPFRAYIIGGPIYRTTGSQFAFDELRAEVAALNIADRVGFTGFLPDVAPAYRALDVVVHASTRPEPFGLAILQSMACGRATIISGSGGAVEVIGDESCALRHEPGNVYELCERLEHLLKHRKEREQLGESARKRAELLFGQDLFQAALNSAVATIR